MDDERNATAKEQQSGGFKHSPEILAALRERSRRRIWMRSARIAAARGISESAAAGDGREPRELAIGPRRR